MVVLSPEPKATMDRELALALPDYRTHLRLYTRTGQPTALRDLQRVGAAQAKTVMFIKPPNQQLSKVPWGVLVHGVFPILSVAHCAYVLVVQLSNLCL